MHYILISFISMIAIWFLLTGCTISLQNISTNGRAEDVVDDQLEATADVKPNIETSVVP